MGGSEISGWGVMALGMVVVFFGLVCLIYITKLMGAIYGAFSKKKKTDITGADIPDQAPQSSGIENRPQFVAAVAAAIAGTMDSDPDGLRIHSIRKVG